MASITINIPDAVAPRVIDAIASEFHWDSSSGVTKNAFAKQQIIEWMKGVVKVNESNKIGTTKEQEKITAQQANDQDVDNNVNIT